MNAKKGIPDDEFIRALAKRFEELVVSEKLFLGIHFNLDEASKLLKTNRGYLSRAVNSVFVKSFSRLINELRVQEAITVMAAHESEKPLTVEAVARRVGFNDRRTFFTAFKRIMGMSPTEYRNRQEMIDAKKKPIFK